MDDTTLLLNGHILAGSEDTYTQALAVRNGRIAAMGNNEQVQSLFPSMAHIIDLQGATVWPGLTDFHLHLRLLGERLAALDCEGCALAQILERLRVQAEQATPNSWITGYNWNHNLWAPPLYGTRQQLDAVSNGHPVVLFAKSLHASWANSAALALAGIQHDTPDPTGGQILRDAAGEPTGILLENAMRLVDGVLPEASPQQMATLLLAAQKHLFSLGITRVHDFDRWEHLLALLALESNGQWKLRVRKCLPVESLPEILQGDARARFANGERITPGWIKAFADGALGPQSAAILAPYEGSDNLGFTLLSAQDVLAMGISASNAGWPMAIHAIGDAANREVLNGYALLREYETSHHLPHLPHRVEHAQLLAPEDFSRFASLGITASVQPIHATSDMDMADRYWGKRCASAYAYNSLLQSGAQLFFGSDAPVESANPFRGIHAAVTRQKADFALPVDGWYPEQRVSLAQALLAYTSGAWLRPGNTEAALGLVVGAEADLIVLDEDPFRVSPSEIWRLAPRMTMVSGEVVYENANVHPGTPG